jgi:hypothetical protein
MPKPFAFVLMPFAEGFNDIYEFAIKQAASAEGILAERLDNQVFFQKTMLDRIYSEIDRADIIIADMSGRNPNVFYEVGYAHAKQKICVLLTSNADDIPFDLRHYRHIVYESSIKTLKAKLRNDLRKIKKELAEHSKAIEVTMARPQTTLVRNPFWAEGRVNLSFDFNNRTDFPSSEIDAIYFYSGSGWSFSIDKRQCARAESDVKGYTNRHLLAQIPGRRLERKNGWLPLRLEGVKALDYPTGSRATRDNYKTNEKFLVRVSAGGKLLDFPFAASNLIFHEHPADGSDVKI